jgi:hypothetical protein
MVLIFIVVGSKIEKVFYIHSVSRHSEENEKTVSTLSLLLA